jgi:hypothetical protein
MGWLAPKKIVEVFYKSRCDVWQFLFWQFISTLFDAVLDYIKSKMEIIEHSCCPDLVRFMLCSAISGLTVKIAINLT